MSRLKLSVASSIGAHHKLTLLQPNLLLFLSEGLRLVLIGLLALLLVESSFAPLRFIIVIILVGLLLAITLRGTKRLSWLVALKWLARLSKCRETREPERTLPPKLPPNALPPSALPPNTDGLSPLRANGEAVDDEPPPKVSLGRLLAQQQ